MFRTTLLTLVLLVGSPLALAQSAPEENVALGKQDPHCLDLYDALDACGQVETEEQTCEDLRTSEDLPFNEVQAVLDHWPASYGAQGQWFDHCRAACRGKPKAGVAAFAKDVCKLTIHP